MSTAEIPEGFDIPNFNDPNYLLSHGWTDTGNWMDPYRQANTYSGNYSGVRLFPASDSDGKPLFGSMRILVKPHILPAEPTDIKIKFPTQYGDEYARILKSLEKRRLSRIESFQAGESEKWFRGTSLAWVIYAGYLDDGLLRSLYYEGTILSDNPGQSILYANDYLNPDKRQKDKDILERLGLPVPEESLSTFWQPIVLGFPNTFSVVKENLAFRTTGPLALNHLSERSREELVDLLGLQPDDKIKKLLSSRT
jgi:hypothetical protein